MKRLENGCKISIEEAEKEIRRELFEQGLLVTGGLRPEDAPTVIAQRFKSEDECWKSSEEMYAYFAQEKINAANQKIREMNDEIAKQQAIIDSSNKIILKYKRVLRTSKATTPGRPARLDSRDQLVKYFVVKWVESLKEALEVTNCGGLAKLIDSTTDRNWRRWLNGDAAPSYSSFEGLLNSRVSYGKYKGELLQSVPVNPTHNQILTLLRFV